MRIFSSFLIFYFPVVLLAGGVGSQPGFASVSDIGAVTAKLPSKPHLAIYNEPEEPAAMYLFAGGSGTSPGSTILRNNEYFDVSTVGSWFSSPTFESTSYYEIEFDKSSQGEGTTVKVIGVDKGVVHFSLFQAGKVFTFIENEEDLEKHAPELLENLVKSYESDQRPVLVDLLTEI